jgi:transposase
MPYVKTFERNQMMLCSWDMLVDEHSTARIIDAFVNSLDLSKYGVKEMAYEGRPSYDPKGLFKLYIYGHRFGIRSSRRLAASCITNIEVKRMLGGVEPDFRTISDFRKDNIGSMKKIFHEFNRRVADLMEHGTFSIDGSKFNACNSKNSNFTKTKLDDRIKWLDAHISEYFRLLEENDSSEETAEGETDITREMLEAKLREAEQRLELYKSYQKIMEESGVSQMSLVDADAKLMKSKNGFGVSYNPQTAVDSNTHMIMDYNMTNQVTDHGLMYPTMEGLKKQEPDRVIECMADKGYQKTEDMVECLENGIIPHVITNDGQDGYEIEITYTGAENADSTSTKSEELNKCMHAGIVPEAYKDVIEKMEVVESRKRVYDEPAQQDSDVKKPVYGTADDMKRRAMEGYFVRDPEGNVVYCPMGQTLRQKSIKSDGRIRYANKQACRSCPNRNKCYNGKNDFKEVDFTKDGLEKPCRGWEKEESEAVSEATTDEAMEGNAKTTTDASATKEASEGKKKYHYEKEKRVTFILKPDRVKTAERMCVSEHPFGTIKRAMGSAYFLLRGLEKVDGEFALFCLGYNLQRALNMVGFDKLMKAMVGA